MSESEVSNGLLSSNFADVLARPSQGNSFRGIAPPSKSGISRSVLPVDPGFVVQADVHQKFTKGEDVVFCHRADPESIGRRVPIQDPGDTTEWKLNYDVFVVADGHSGKDAVRFVQEELLAQLHPMMPCHIPHTFTNACGREYAQQVRLALTNTFHYLNDTFCALGVRSGCTLSVAVVTGRLLTVANLGDSDAVLDCFTDVLKMSMPHRVNDNVQERQRVQNAGSYLAPIATTMDGAAEPNTPGVGPLRIWPGGLCVSRGIGDIDVGPVVIATPHICQVIIPEHGSRLILASDGVWDCLKTSTVISTSRKLAPRHAASSIVDKCLRVKQGFLIDDTTCCIIDFVPHGIVSFKGYTPEKALKEGSLKISTAPHMYRAKEMAGDQFSTGGMASSVSVVPDDLVNTVSITSSPADIDKSFDASSQKQTDISLDAPVQNLPRRSHRPDKPRKVKSAGMFSCCLSPSTVEGDESDGPVATRSKGGQPHRVAATQSEPELEAGASAHDSKAGSASGSASRRSRFLTSLSSSMRNGTSSSPLQRVTHFYFMDMALDQGILAVGTLDKVTEGQPPTREAYGMDFEPTSQTAPDPAGGQDPHWHTMSPTDPDFTTRPHKLMQGSMITSGKKLHSTQDPFVSQSCTASVSG